MTIKEQNELKRFAKEQVSEYLEYSIPMNKMVLLECGYTTFEGIQIPDYVMFEDVRDGREYQVTLHGAECTNENEIFHKELMAYGEVIEIFNSLEEKTHHPMTVRIIRYEEVLYLDYMVSGSVVRISELS